MLFSIAFPTSESRSGWKYSTKIETMSIFISVVPVVQQTSDIDDGQAASLKIDIRHQCLHERHQPRAGGRLDLQNVLRWKMQHCSNAADLSAVRRSGSQADQLPVVERSRLRRTLVGLHCNDQMRASYLLGAGPVDQLSEPDQQPAGMIPNRQHREEPRAALFPKYLTRGEPTLRFIGAEVHRDLAVYAVGPPDDTDQGVGGQLLAPLAAGAQLSLPLLGRFGDCLAATAIRAATREPIDVDEVDTYLLVAGQRADHRA